ncbi:hypothetical protein SAMN05216474_1758 [Lishizhenia tianjinensis]|uniref:Uncharacterized protein n=2 Tax=Lishizhenia tianjinensis TaxID=477690 RepID=A0A1I6ZZH0_9FLAO|nr:hypothetical protein SAMN05216474_1758 [Lishizhenia tianjinensis]
MQTKLLIIGLLLASTYSCQSEYDRQMEKARAHMKSVELMAKQERQILEMEALMREVDRDIAICAEMSGNKRLFLEELEYVSEN